MAQHAENNHEEHHIVPAQLLTKILIALLALTILTVVTAQMHLGAIAGLVAFAIAGVKAYMVMAYFMGLKYDSASNRLIFASGFIFLGIMFFFCILDILTRVSQSSTL
jgi:cytochrome c oxidase subunit 4